MTFAEEAVITCEMKHRKTALRGGMATSDRLCRWKKFLNNATGALVGLRGLLMEFHVLVGVLMLITLALLEFWHVVSRMIH